MTDSQEAAKNGRGMSARMRGGHNQRNHLDRRGQDDEVRRLAEQDASEIVAEAYREAAKIIDEAKRKAGHIIGGADMQDAAAYKQLVDLVKAHKIATPSYEQIDDLFAQIRHHLSAAAESDQINADELNELVNQIEYWVDSLVVDSLKLKSIQHWLQGTTELAKRLRAKLDRK